MFILIILIENTYNISIKQFLQLNNTENYERKILFLLIKKKISFYSGYLGRYLNK